MTRRASTGRIVRCTSAAVAAIALLPPGVLAGAHRPQGPSAAAVCQDAAPAFERGRAALVSGGGQPDAGSAWILQQWLRLHPDPGLARVIEQSKARLGSDPAARLLDPALPPIALPARLPSGIQRMAAAVLAPLGTPHERAVGFIRAFVERPERGYVLTHQLLVLLWAPDMGLELPADLRGRRTDLMQRIAAEQAADVRGFSDLASERIALLLCFGTPARRDAARWLQVLLRAQATDGRWHDPRPSSITYDGQSATAMHDWRHTTAMAVVAAGAFRRRHCRST